MNEYVFSITDRDGTVTFVRVQASDPVRANALILSKYGSAVTQVAYRGNASSFSQSQLGNMDQIGEGTQPVRPGGTLGGNTTPSNMNVTPDTQLGIESAQPYSAFAAGLGQQGLNTEGPLGSILRDQYVPSRAGFDFSRFSGMPAPSASYQDYVAQTGPNAYTTARNAFNSISGGAQMSTPSNEAALRSAGIGDTEEQQKLRSSFQNLARGAATAQYGLAEQFLPTSATLGRGFDQQLYAQAQRGPQAQGISYVDYLRKQFGL